MAQVVAPDELPRTGNTYKFEGQAHGDVPVTLLLDSQAPGSGPRLHRHPYAEVHVVQEGCAAYSVGGATLEVTGGHIVVMPPSTPHKFVNVGDGPLRLVAIHLSAKTVTEWLED